MRQMRPRFVALLAGLFLALLVGGATAAPTQVAERLDQLFRDPQLASASIGALVVATDTGDVLYDRDPDRSLVPASNMKLITAAVALDRLKAPFRYTTETRADSAPKAQGWVVGDLYLRGGAIRRSPTPISTGSPHKWQAGASHA
jgi:D-alanyl-D-alanine carboxypeptidase/D-alanyl-D-alanine-endopeptidase (penicillin-binding protein 4)